VRDVRTIEWRDRVVAQVQDVRRTLDYLESRPDLDATRPVYYGHSWGAAMAPLVLVIEQRFVGGVLYLPGLIPGRLRTEVNPITFIHHVRVPVLALSGRIDPVFAFGVHAQPFFSMLGTPAAAKRHVATWSGHWVPRTTLVREVLDWLDRQLGPVESR
jgi:predicted esterase